MKDWERYHNLRGDWHIHSTFSDGRNEPGEIIEAAISLGLELVAITDHVNRESEWLDDFVIEIERLKSRYDDKIKILSGIEAKVIDLDGNIDAREEFFKKVDIVLGAFHRIPNSNGFISREEIPVERDRVLNFWYKAFLSLLEKDNHVDIIAHPTNILKINGIDVPLWMKREITRVGRRTGKIFEFNLKYNVPDEEFINMLREKDIPMSIGGDAHSVEELKETYRRSKDIYNNMENIFYKTS